MLLHIKIDVPHEYLLMLSALILKIENGQINNVTNDMNGEPQRMDQNHQPKRRPHSYLLNAKRASIRSSQNLEDSVLSSDSQNTHLSNGDVPHMEGNALALFSQIQNYVIYVSIYLYACVRGCMYYVF